MSAPRPRRVLIVRLGALGDVVNSLTLAAAAKAAEPELELDWVAHDLALPLLVGHPLLRRVHHWPRGGGVGALARLVRALRRERYDLALDLQRLQKSALLARLCGAGRTLGFDRGRAKEASWIWHRERLAPGDPLAPMARQALDFALHLAWLHPGDPALLRLERPLVQDPAAAEKVGARLAELPGAPVVVNVGASKPANRWRPERFAELARALVEAGYPVVLSGGPSDRDWMGASRLACRGAADWVGGTSVRELVELMRRARLYVGCDTGPMHVAAAVGTPALALFGPADPRRTGPVGPTRDGLGHRVLQAESRRMEDLHPEEVCSAALARLAQSRP